MRHQVNGGRPGSRIALPVVGTTDPDEVLGENPLVEGMHIDSRMNLVLYARTRLCALMKMCVLLGRFSQST